MTRQPRSPLFRVLLALVLTGCVSAGPRLPPPPVHPNGQALWRIIHDRCVPDEIGHADPAPCAKVVLPSGGVDGYVVLKDRDGVAQHLLMPTAKITGIEDAALLQPGATNYFAKAWDERGLVESRLGRPLDRTQVSVAVNSPYGRSQDQLHLHIDCVEPAVVAALRAAKVPHAGRWAAQTVRLKDHAYRVRWLDAEELASTNPFDLLARSMPGARQAMGAWTLALVGATAPDGAPGFYLLADRVQPATGDRASAEELQDHACRL